MRFDDIEIDRTRFELRQGGAAVPVEPKVFDLLCHLIDNANQLVTKDDLIEHVWQGRIVSDSALSTAIKSARRALGESGKRIATLRGRGFRLDLPEAPINAPSATRAAPEQVYTQPSLAIIAPEGLGDQGGYAARWIARAMSRVPFLTVIAPGAVAALDDTSPAAIRAEFGPGFLLEMTANRGSRVILDAALVDTASLEALWVQQVRAETLDTGLIALAAQLQPQLLRAIHLRLSGRAAESAQALTMEGLGTMSLRGWNPSAFEAAEAKLSGAVAIDDSLAVAHAALALVLALGPRIGMSEPTDERRAQAIHHADRAMDIDDMSPAILGLAGCALCDAGQGVRGQSVLERALSLDADNPQALAALGAHLLSEKRLDQSVELLQRAVASAPQDNVLAIWSSVLALALLKSDQPEAAYAAARRAVAADDRSHFPKITLAAVALAREQTDVARDALSDAYRVSPDLHRDQIAAAVGQTAADALMALRARAGT